MKQNPPAAAKGGQQSEADRDALFRQFQAWQSDQTARENARAQVVAPAVAPAAPRPSNKQQ
jgi:hypothetical protein